MEGAGGRTGYRFVLSPVTSGGLRFEVEVKDGSFDRVFLTYASLPDERFFGFGTQYTHLAMKGRRVPIFIQGQGIGRGVRAWIKDVIKENLVEGGASGWMEGFGEGLPYDAVLHSGESPASCHNRYAEEWARINREAIREVGRGMRSSFLPAPATLVAPARAPCSGSGTSSCSGGGGMWQLPSLRV